MGRLGTSGVRSVAVALAVAMAVGGTMFAAPPAGAGIAPAPEPALVPAAVPGAFPGTVSGAVDGLEAAASWKDPVMSSAVRKLAHGAPPATVLDRRNIRPDGRVVLVAEATGARALVEALAGRGAVQRAAGAGFRIAVAPGHLTALAAAPGIVRLRERALLEPAGVVSEGATKLKVAAQHDAGRTGKVPVAVIDTGFAGWQAMESEGELGTNVRTKGFCENSGFESDPHGTAVAEIVHDMAPAASLHLICVEDDGDLALASEYLRANGIEIANTSLGTVVTGFGNGKEPSPSPYHTVARDRAAGILHVVSAGNEADRHWGSPFRDTDGNDIHEFATGADSVGNTIVVPPFSEARAILRWDEFDVRRTDLDLLALDQAGNLVALSADDQLAGHPPVEGMLLTNPYSSAQAFQLAIGRYAGTASPEMDLFIDGAAGIQYRSDLRSVSEPATSPGALAVGAVCQSSGGLQFFSSRGPTSSGRIKPDLVSYDAVSTVSFGSNGSGGCDEGFAGTSAAAPHVAGAAAMVAAANPAMTAADIARWLKQNAKDLGPAGADPYFGSGALRVPDVSTAGELRNTGTPTERYVNQAYRDFLFRFAGSSEIAYWSGQLASGLSRSAFANSLASSDEWVRTVFDRMYRDTLGRDADDGGFRYWKDIYDRGMLLSEIAALIYSSDEYFRRVGGTDSAYVKALFQAMLGRAASAADVSHWTGQLAQFGRIHVASTLYRTQESRLLRVAGLYEQLLGRYPESGGHLYWAEQLQRVDAVALASFLASSDEYFTRAQSQ